MADYAAMVEIALFIFPDGQINAIDAICPHSGGPLYMGDIEDLCSNDTDTHTNNDDKLASINGYRKGKAVICPYHFYDFNLKDGSSIIAEEFSVQTYPAVLALDGKSIEIEFPHRNASLFSLVRIDNIQSPCQDSIPAAPVTLQDTHIANVPLMEHAIDILNTANSQLKVSKTFKISEEWTKGTIQNILSSSSPPSEPPRDHLRIIPCGKNKNRGKGGTVESRIALLHSLANIEQWAIDLAWDIIARFASIVPEKDRPDFCSDFVKVAADEAKHFTLLSTRLVELGSFYGAHPIHAGLWESADKTSHDLISRLAIVHMVHEARGLDVNPATIAKFRKANDEESVRILSIIHEDEVTHVAVGQKWFSLLCSSIRDDITDKISHFQSIVRDLFHGPLKPPFNALDRKKAGLSEEWYLSLSEQK